MWPGITDTYVGRYNRHTSSNNTSVTFSHHERRSSVKRHTSCMRSTAQSDVSGRRRVPTLHRSKFREVRGAVTACGGGGGGDGGGGSLWVCFFPLPPPPLALTLSLALALCPVPPHSERARFSFRRFSAAACRRPARRAARPNSTPANSPP